MYRKHFTTRRRIKKNAKNSGKELSRFVHYYTVSLSGKQIPPTTQLCSNITVKNQKLTEPWLVVKTIERVPFSQVTIVIWQVLSLDSLEKLIKILKAKLSIPFDRRQKT